MAGLFRNPATSGLGWRFCRCSIFVALQSAAGLGRAQPAGTAAFAAQGSRGAAVRDFHGVDGAALPVRERAIVPSWLARWTHWRFRTARHGRGRRRRGPRSGRAGGSPSLLLAGRAGRCWRGCVRALPQFERNLRFRRGGGVQATPQIQRRDLRGRASMADAFYFRFPARSLPRSPGGNDRRRSELRSLSRTPRYRMVFVMGFSFGIMVWLPMILGNPAECTDHHSDSLSQLFPRR